jgi:hypothetical protein
MIRAIRAAIGPALVSLIIAACAAAPELPALTGFEQRSSDDAFVLTLHGPRTAWAAGQPIELAATLTYVGPAPQASVVGSGSGLVSFSIEQIDGPFDLGGAGTADCQTRTMTRGQTEVVPYVKSGGWTGEDPMAARFKAFFADPTLKLDAGTYKVTATLEAYVGECGGALHSLSTEVVLNVAG